MGHQLSRRSFLNGLAAALAATQIPVKVEAVEAIAPALDPSRWYHFSFDIDAEQAVKIFIDGVEVNDVPLRVETDINKGTLEFWGKGDLVADLKLKSDKGNFELFGEVGPRISRSLRFRSDEPIFLKEEMK